MEHEIIPPERNMVVEQSTIALLNKSEIDQQIATAHAYPRSIKKFRDEAMAMVTLNESIAQECIYSLPRDGKVIEGPSARFAEIVQSAWGNCRAGARVVNEGSEFITAQGVFHDLEKNAAITYEVQRRITNKHGKRFKADMIGVTGNAACSIALRNAILKGVPKAFWADMYEAARRTIMGDFKTLNNRRAAAIDSFKAYGVKQEEIFALLQVGGVEDIAPEHLVTLRGVLTALKEGETTVEEAFGRKTASAPTAPAAPKAPVDSAPKENVQSEIEGDAPPASAPKAKAPKAPAAAPKTAQQAMPPRRGQTKSAAPKPIERQAEVEDAETVDPETGEVKGNHISIEPEAYLDTLRDNLGAAKTKAQVTRVWNEHLAIEQHLSAEDREAAGNMLADAMEPFTA